MSRFIRQFSPIYETIKKDIFAFCRAMNFTPTFQQQALLEAVQRGDKRVAVKSGQGCGKSSSSVIIGLWRCLRAYNAMTIVTAPTMRQCRDVWLGETRRLLENADPWLKYFIKVTKSKIEIAGCPDWGVKLVTATREENAQGYHQPNMTVIGEESSGIPREIITQFKGTLSNEDSMLLLIGNPNVRDCALFDCFTSQRKDWTRMTFNAEVTAKYYPHILSPNRNKQLEEEFGRDSDVYRVRVLGEFPHVDPNCILSSEDLARVSDRSLLLKYARSNRMNGEPPAKQFGIDLARFGGDESTVFRRSGNSIVEWDAFAHQEPSVILDEAMKMQAMAEWRDSECWYVVDAGGIGQGALHRLYEHRKQVMEFHNGGRASEKDYENKITEGWFNLAKMVKKQACCLPDDAVTIKQLSNRMYFTTKKGKLIVESKDEYMKRGFDSPDRADGIVEAFYDRVYAAGHVSSRNEESRVG